MNTAVLDTDMLSEIIKRVNPIVLRHARHYELVHGRLTFSAYTRFERRRDLVVKGATRQLKSFDHRCGESNILPITDEVFDIAADLWAFARRRAKSHADGDLIIAATALLHKFDLVTGNTSHYSWIPSLRLVNWRQP